MTEDNINRPSHYNRNGIEVIDVIETYTPNSPHLANVLKYVCRHSYKGKPIEDLKKARWYLDRAIAIKEEEAAILDDDFEAPRDAYGRVLRASPPVNIDGDILWSDEDAESVVDALYVRTSPSRIAGDDDAAMRIKADYYRFDPFAIVGYCANCDKELCADDNFLQDVEGYYSNVKFCSDGCVKTLRAWQGRNPQ